MNTLCLLLITAGLLVADVCDGKARVGANNIALQCIVAAPIVIDGLAVDMHAHATLNIVITADTSDTRMYSLEIGYTSSNGPARKLILIRKAMPTLLKVSATVDLPIDASVTFIQVEQLIRASFTDFQ